MVDDNLLLYGPQIVMYYLYVYDVVESGIKQLNGIELNKKSTTSSNGQIKYDMINNLI